MKRLLILSIFSGTMVSIGCVGMAPKGWYEPEFSASYSPLFGLSVRSTRDDAANINASYNPETKELHLAAEITSSASEVNKSQEKLMELMNRKMEILVDEVRAHGENIRAGMAELRGMVDSVTAPLKGASVDVDGPLGKGGIKTGGGN